MDRNNNPLMARNPFLNGIGEFGNPQNVEGHVEWANQLLGRKAYAVGKFKNAAGEIKSAVVTAIGETA